MVCMLGSMIYPVPTVHSQGRPTDRLHSCLRVRQAGLLIDSNAYSGHVSAHFLIKLFFVGEINSTFYVPITVTQGNLSRKTPVMREKSAKLRMGVIVF